MSLDVPVGFVQRLPDAVQVRLAVRRARRAIRRGLARDKGGTRQDGEGGGNEGRCAQPGSHLSDSLRAESASAAARPAAGDGEYKRPARSTLQLELLDLLSQGARTVEALARQTGHTVATTSHHLQVLERARLVQAEKAGLYVTYQLADPDVGGFFLQLRSLAESRLAEVRQVTRQYLEERGALEPVGDDELVRRVRAGEVTLIDVRPREEYLARTFQAPSPRLSQNSESASERCRNAATSWRIAAARTASWRLTPWRFCGARGSGLIAWSVACPSGGRRDGASRRATPVPLADDP